MNRHQILVELTARLYTSLGHVVQETSEVAGGISDLSIRSFGGENWLVRCDSFKNIDYARTESFVRSRRSGQTDRLALFTTGVMTEEAREFAERESVELVDYAALLGYLTKASARSEADVELGNARGTGHGDAVHTRSNGVAEPPSRAYLPFRADDLQAVGAEHGSPDRDQPSHVGQPATPKGPPHGRRGLALTVSLSVVIGCLATGLMILVGGGLVGAALDAGGPDRSLSPAPPCDLREAMQFSDGYAYTVGEIEMSLYSAAIDPLPAEANTLPLPAARQELHRFQAELDDNERASECYRTIMGTSLALDIRSLKELEAAFDAYDAGDLALAESQLWVVDEIGGKAADAYWSTICGYDLTGYPEGYAIICSNYLSGD